MERPEIGLVLLVTNLNGTYPYDKPELGRRKKATKEKYF